jgi:diadenosine tetraphosphate (Ap4A) HIT family hydrolase
MSDCIFCKIANGEAPCFKIWENDEFMAFLDIMPNVKWQTLLIPKNHYDSDLFLIDDEKFYGRLMAATKEVIDMLKKSLKVQRVWMIMEWMWVNHLHLKLYPMYWLCENREPNESPKHVFFENYPWYLTTQMWDQADMEELWAIQVQITNSSALN